MLLPPLCRVVEVWVVVAVSGGGCCFVCCDLDLRAAGTNLIGETILVVVSSGGFLLRFLFFGGGGVWSLSLSLLLVFSLSLSLVALLSLSSSLLAGRSATSWKVPVSWAGAGLVGGRLCEDEDDDGVVNFRGMMVTHEVTCAELGIVFPVSVVEVGMSRSLQHIVVVCRPHVCVGRNRLWTRSATACRFRMISSWSRVLWKGVSRMEDLASLVCMRSSSVSVYMIESLSSSSLADLVSSSSVAGAARGGGSPSVSQSPVFVLSVDSVGSCQDLPGGRGGGCVDVVAVCRG